MMTSTTAFEEQQQVPDYVRQRFECVHTRTSSRAAAEFFQQQDHHWRSLPQRLERLCQTLQRWNAQVGSPELPFQFSAIDNSSSSSSSNDPQQAARRTALTAAVLALASSQPSSCCLNDDFESLFRYLLQQYESNNNKSQTTAVARYLHQLGWLRGSSSGSGSNTTATSLLQQPLEQAIHNTILAKVKETIAGDYETENLYEKVVVWRNAVVVPWLQDILLHDATTSNNKEELLRKIDFVSAECYCLVRSQEIFEIVADYPDSHTAIVELRNVLDVTKMHHQLVGQVLRSQLIRRLNHPGANTSQIIDVYIATIKVLRVIDPSDRLLSLVAEPVRSYLRGRRDTVRCIISSLTDAEVGGDLYQELRRQDAKPLEDVTVDSDDEEECPDFDWQPQPSVNTPRGTFLEGAARGAGGDSSDILAMLVSIYGSKELFVNEYRLMLADKLLANLDYNTDKEVHTLELLKLRFGEMSMRNCEVMIKDMYDSKRTNANIRSTLETKRRTSSATTSVRGTAKPVTDVAMVSHIFWPTLQNDQLKHHPRIQAELDEFSTEYARLKNPRKLIWLDQLGTVELELDVVEDSAGPDGIPIVKTKEITCTPLLATLISHFEDQSTWTAEELSNETGVPEHIVQKRMAFWINNRVVELVKNTAATISSNKKNSSSVVYKITSPTNLLEGDRDVDSTSMMEDEDGSEGQAVSVTAQEEEEMEVYESYIVGMLMNLQQLPLERIHSMLKTCVTGSDHKYSKTPQQLGAFLQHLCKQEKLECGPDGMYKLFKK